MYKVSEGYNLDNDEDKTYFKKYNINDIINASRNQMNYSSLIVGQKKRDFSNNSDRHQLSNSALKIIQQTAFEHYASQREDRGSPSFDGELEKMRTEKKPVKRFYSNIYKSGKKNTAAALGNNLTLEQRILSGEYRA